MGGFAKSAGVDRNVWCLTGEGKLVWPFELSRISENRGFGVEIGILLFLFDL